MSEGNIVKKNLNRLVQMNEQGVQNRICLCEKYKVKNNQNGTNTSMGTLKNDVYDEGKIKMKASASKSQ